MATSQAMNKLIESSYLTLCKVQKYLMVELETPAEKPAIGAKAKRLAKELDRQMKFLAQQHTRPEVFNAHPFSKASNGKTTKPAATAAKSTAAKARVKH
jgi:hypothetical protein